MNQDTLLWLLAAAVATFMLVNRGRLIAQIYKEVMRFFIVMELTALKIVQWIYPPKYAVVGECHKRGTCCEMIQGDPPDWIKKTFLLEWFAGYHRLMHNFHPIGRGPKGELIFRCGHLQRDGRCGIYRYRPLICRNYPVVPWFEAPRPIPGCGYRVVDRRLKDHEPRAGLPILNPTVAVHHPTREGGRLEPEAPEHYEEFDPS